MNVLRTSTGIVALVVAAPIAFGAMGGVVVALRALGNFVWPIALATFLTVWLPLAMLIQRARMKRVRARLRGRRAGLDLDARDDRAARGARRRR